MRSDPTLLVVAVVTVVALVPVTRHGRTWWHRHTGEHHAARTARLVIAGGALLGLVGLTVGMALGGSATAAPSAGAADPREEPGGLVLGGPVPGVPATGPVTATAGS